MPADQKRDEHGASFQSLPKINRKTHLHKMKVYNTRPVYSLTIETFTSIHLFQSIQRFQAIEFVDRPFPEKLDIFRINLS